MEAFNQDRSTISAITSLVTTSTNLRPRTGTWFQGRVWYTGVDASFTGVGAPKFSWSENIYFSQIVETTDQFAKCYQVNDPTNEEFPDLLPSDGGQLTIQGAGTIYKLFPIQNGLLVFSANGIYFITGSQGIGFTATDFTVTELSSVESISGKSFIDVLGYPVFWNEEGIYTVGPGENGQLVVTNLCLNTISSFYEDIPIISKQFARGDYDPINFIVKWVYRSTVETNTTDRYQFDRVLNIKMPTKAFYTYTIANSSTEGPFVHDIKFINNPGGSSVSMPSACKYWISSGETASDRDVTFAEENDETNWVDFFDYDGVGNDYTSYFVTGYRLAGQGLVKFQPIHVQVYAEALRAFAYKIQGIWDFANSPNSGRYTTIQTITNALSRYGIIYKKHKIRGHGVSLQLKFSSVPGLPFDIVGWGSLEVRNERM